MPGGLPTARRVVSGMVEPDDPVIDRLPFRLWSWYCPDHDTTLARSSCDSAEYFDGIACPKCGNTMLGPFIYRLIRPAPWFTGQLGRATERTPAARS